MEKTINRESVLRRTNWGVDIYAHILRQFYPGEVVMRITGRDCGIVRNPFAGGVKSLHIWFAKNDPDARLSDETAYHKDQFGAIPDGDALANTFGSDYGNDSDGVRKAFHHEAISYIRRKDREYVNIKHPRLSTLLTGTPRQILNLISDAENGLFSRFAFYYLNTRIVWNNVFDADTDATLDEAFQKMGTEYQDLYNILHDGKELLFSLTADQQQDFNHTFDAWQDEYVAVYGEEFVASVRRLGVITFRLAMCISVLRLAENGNFEDDIVCLDEDYASAKAIASVLIQHNAKVFSTLPTAPDTPQSNIAKTTLLQEFYDSLPENFDRKLYSQLAERLGLNPKSIDRTVRKWCESGKLENVAHGKYAKSK